MFLFLIHIATAWILWRVFYWKCPYAAALAIAAGAGQWAIEYVTDSMRLSVLVVVPAAIVIARVMHRESIFRPTSRGGGGGRYSYRLDDEGAPHDADGDGPPRSG